MAHDADNLELKPTLSRRTRPSFVAAEELSPTFTTRPIAARSQGVPPELGSLPREIVCVSVCSTGQLLFSWLQGDVNVNLYALQHTLSIQATEIPWVAGAFLLALGLSVVLSGSLTDLASPKHLIVAAFVWLTLWNIVGVFSITMGSKMVFFITRAMQGLAVGVLVSGSMSILGRVYKPGRRKTRVFSAMAAMAPFGFWLGALQGGLLTARLEWIFATNAMISGLACLAAFWTIPSLRPVADRAGVAAPTLRSFDYQGGMAAVSGCVCLIFGLTQGSVVHWSPYTYVLIILGILLLALFFFIETRVPRPLIPPQLWRTPGFAPLMLAYFLGFGGFLGAWQFYAVQFFLRIQHVSALTVALYLIPNAIVGVLATVLVSHLLHRIPGTWIYLASMFAFALGPAFFLPQTAATPYWALSMPGIGLATFGPDLSFAAASIFITSNVPRSYQGSAGSVLVTVQNLSSAVMTAIGDAIASKVGTEADGTIGLHGLKAAWWFALAAAVTGGVVTASMVRIPKEEEKEHIT